MHTFDQQARESMASEACRGSLDHPPSAHTAIQTLQVAAGNVHRVRRRDGQICRAVQAEHPRAGEHPYGLRACMLYVPHTGIMELVTVQGTAVLRILATSMRQVYATFEYP